MIYKKKIEMNFYPFFRVTKPKMSINPCIKCKHSYNKKGLIGFSCGYCGLVIDYVNNIIHNPTTIPNPEPIIRKTLP